MKKYLLLTAIVFSMSASFASAFGDEHLKGYIDDSMCAKSPMCTPATRINCAQKCIQSGAKAVLVVGKKVYKISNQDFVVKYAGKDVSVDGKVTNDSIEVTKIDEAKTK